MAAWRRDPYRIDRAPDLPIAIATAIDALLDVAARRAWHHRHPTVGATSTAYFPAG